MTVDEVKHLKITVQELLDALGGNSDVGSELAYQIGYREIALRPTSEGGPLVELAICSSEDLDTLIAVMQIAAKLYYVHDNAAKGDPLWLKLGKLLGLPPA